MKFILFRWSFAKISKILIASSKLTITPMWHTIQKRVLLINTSYQHRLRCYEVWRTLTRTCTLQGYSWQRCATHNRIMWLLLGMKQQTTIKCLCWSMPSEKLPMYRTKFSREIFDNEKFYTHKNDIYEKHYVRLL